MTDAEVRPPLPPFSLEDAIIKVRKAEDAWNRKVPEACALAYSPDTQWRNRSEFLTGREEVIDFLTRKWSEENDYRLIKELWAYGDDRIAVRFCYEWHDDKGNWFRSHGNENWMFDDKGLMKERHASINDVPIQESERKFLWDTEVRPEGFPGLSELGL